MNMSMTIVNDRQPTLRTRLVFLLGCSALSVFIPNVSYAQQSSNPSAPLVLETITVDGKTRGDDDRNSIVATQTTSGANFEILVGFDVTPEMAAFNRDGKRFRLNAGTAVAGNTNENK